MFLHGARSIFELDEIDCVEQCGRRVMDGRESVGNNAYLSSRKCKMARVALDLGVRDLAKLAKLAPGTVSRFEVEEELKETVDALQAALAAAGVTSTRTGTAPECACGVERSDQPSR